MEEYRVIIAGCLDFYNYFVLKEKCMYYLQNKLQTHAVIVVSGHATGADSLGEKFASDLGLGIELHPAEWEKYGNYAGPKRNKEMAEVSNALIAFWDGKSRGTKSMIEEARKNGLKIAIVRIDQLYKKGEPT